MTESLLRQMIREIIQQELDETSTSAATPGYMTPNAFQGDSEAGRKKHQSNIEKTREYTIVDPDSLKEGRSRYLDFKKDDSATTVQKIGRTLMEMNKSLTEMERVVGMAARLKTETNTPNSQLWKRSLNHLVKIEGRILKLAHRIQELKK